MLLVGLTVSAHRSYDHGRAWRAPPDRRIGTTMPDTINNLPAGFGNAEIQTMSSREIAELTGKEHRHVIRDVEAMFAGLEMSCEGYAQNWTHPQNGQVYREFLLPKDLTLTLVAGYNVKLRKAIIDRWQHLEAKERFDPAVALSDPASLRTLLLENVERVLALQGEVEEMRPQVQALERIAISDGSLCVTDAAKTLQVQPKSLFSFLKEHHWIYTRQGDNAYIAYQDKLQRGVLEHKTTVVTRSDGSEKTTTQVRVTPKGLTRLAKEFPPVAQAA